MQIATLPRLLKLLPQNMIFRLIKCLGVIGFILLYRKDVRPRKNKNIDRGLEETKQENRYLDIGVNGPTTNDSLILIELTDHQALSGAQMTRTSN